MGQAGFYLINDGATAHDISVESFEIGPSMRASSGVLSRIGEKEKGFLLVWFDGFSPSQAEQQLRQHPCDDTAENWNLQRAMAKAAQEDKRVLGWQWDYTIKVRVNYRDSRNTWYRSSADLVYIQSQMRLQFGSTKIEFGEPAVEMNGRPMPTASRGTSATEETMAGPRDTAQQDEPGCAEAELAPLDQEVRDTSEQIGRASTGTDTATVHDASLDSDDATSEVQSNAEERPAGTSPILDRQAEWRDDAAFALECPDFLRPAKAVRLTAIARLRRDAAEAFRRIKPQTREDLEQCMWQVFLEYAGLVFDRAAEVELGASGPSVRPEEYGIWVRSKCLAAVIDDVCQPIYGQFPITVRYLAETVREATRPEELVRMRQVVWMMYADEVIPNASTERLRNYLMNTLLEERAPLWDAKAAQMREHAEPAPAETTQSSIHDLPRADPNPVQRGKIDGPAFRQGAKDYPYVYARWDSLQKLWTLYDQPLDDEGSPDPYESVLAGPDAAHFLREAVRMAVSWLRQTKDLEIRAVATTLRNPLCVWLDLMRTKERGFRRTLRLTRWRGGKSVEDLLDSGAAPPDARLTENGTIARLFQESAAFWDDIVDLGFDAEALATARQPANQAPATPGRAPTAEDGSGGVTESASSAEDQAKRAARREAAYPVDLVFHPLQK